MKRKLALLLAAVMTTTMLPMNLFAKSSNALERTIAAVEDNTVIIQKGFTATPGSFTTGYAKDTGTNDDVEGYMVGSDFVIDVDSTITTGDSIDLRLDNATWMYQSRKLVAPTAAALVSAIDPDIIAAFVLTTAASEEIGRIEDGGTVKYTSDGSLQSTIDENLGYMATPGTGPAYDSAYIRVASSSAVDYVMAFSGVDDSLATLKFNRVLDKDYKIRIPMAILVPDSEKEVSVTISGSNTAVTTGKYVILSAVAGGSIMTTSSVKTFRTSGKLGTISVKELKLGSLKTNASKGFTVTLADGYEFISSAANLTTVSSLELVSGGASFIGAYTDDDEYTVTVSGSGMTHTTNLATIYIEGLNVKSPKTISNEEINLTIEDLGGSNDMGVTTETVKVAKYADFGVSFAKTNSGDKIPALVAGREAKDSGDDNKVVKFKLSESVAGTIATGRDTKLIFPEDIKVLKVAVKPSTAGDWNTIPGASYDGDNLNEVTITDLSKIKAATNKVNLEFEAWVSIPASFAGNDITVTAVNAGITADVEPLVVATTVAPISVETTVTTIKIGSQAQAVSNIKIVENVAGALQKGKEVLVTITDAYGSATNNNLIIATGAKRTVTDGDIDVSLSSTTTTVSAGSVLIGTNGNTLKLTIDRASRKASTIELSNLFVKANNDLPETNGVPYKVYVYGTAVAFNYGSKAAFTNTFALGETKGNYDQLVNSGYFANFLEVAGTQVAGAATIPSKEFILVAGATSALVDGNAVEFTTDMAAYLDPAGTVMLSTRLISEAFGLVPLWDDATRTVTIVDLAGNPVVMFPVGKTYYVKGGMNVPMVNNGVVATTVVKDGRTFVSLRQMANALGFGDKVQWDDSTKTVTLNKKATN